MRVKTHTLIEDWTNEKIKNRFNPKTTNWLKY
jgi:hypothetical protein